MKSRLFVAIVRSFFFSEVIFKWSDFKGGRKINLEITLFMEREREGEGEASNAEFIEGKFSYRKRLNDAQFCYNIAR